LQPRAQTYPQACTLADLESADLVIALQEVEHRGLLSVGFPGWENRIIFWHVHDIDVAPPKEAIDTIEQHVDDLIQNIRSQAS
jgi:protein-tyrosine phosphatase